MAEAEQQEAHSEPAGGGGGTSGGGNKLMLIITIVNTLATLGIAVVMFIGHQKEASQPRVEDIVVGAKKKEAHGEKKEGEGHGGGHGEGHGEGGKEAVHAEVEGGKMMSLDPFTVNLASGIGTQPRYVRMNVSIELEDGVQDDEFKVKTPRVRDTVISLLNSKKASDIASLEGRELLKDEIKRSVNGYMTTSKVKGVYFTNFAIAN